MKGRGIDHSALPLEPPQLDNQAATVRHQPYTTRFFRDDPVLIFRLKSSCFSNVCDATSDGCFERLDVYPGIDLAEMGREAMGAWR